MLGWLFGYFDTVSTAGEMCGNLPQCQTDNLNAKRDRNFSVYLCCIRPGQELANQHSYLNLQRLLASHRLAAIA
jgi:hypothetical protein